MYLDLSPKRRKYTSAVPHHFNQLKGITYAERRAKVQAQIAGIDRMLACTTCVKARGALLSSRNMLLGTLSYIDSQIARLR